jgi:FixJ family two-component response regulator
MLQTRFCERFGVAAPIVVAPMGPDLTGRELGTCERTVKEHRGHVMERMQLTSVAELVHAADLLMGGGITALPR